MKPAALAIIFQNDRQELLLVQRRDVPVWVLPGGGIDKGETPEQAVLREVREETGLTALVKRKTGCYAPANIFTSTAHVFECEVTGGTLTHSEETPYVQFFNLHELPLHFFPYHKEWLEDALNESFTVQKPMSNRIFLKIVLYYTLRPIWGLKYLWSRLVCSGK